MRVSDTQILFLINSAPTWNSLSFFINTNDITGIKTKTDVAASWSKYSLIFLSFSIYVVLYVDRCNMGNVQYMSLCFARVCASVYMWIVSVSVVVVFIDSSVRQRNVCSTWSPRQISPWGQ